MATLRSERGQSTVETALILPLLMMAAALVIGLSGLTLFSFVLRFQSHELLVCSVTYSRQNHSCEQQFRKALRPLLIYGRIDHLKITSDSRRSQVAISFHWRSSWHPPLYWKFRDQIKNPSRL